MIPGGRYAYANARARALKSRLLDRQSVTLGIRELQHVARRRFGELLAAYDTLIASYPAGQALFLAFLRLHEIENLKLAWRAVMSKAPAERWMPNWIPLEPLAAIGPESVRECRSLNALVDAVRQTPYHAIADTMRRTHAEDLAAAELGFDRWASQALAEAALALPPAERLARELAIAVVRERDLLVVCRASHTYSLPPDGLTGAVAHVTREIGAAAVVALAEWSPADGPLWTRLPRAWTRAIGRPADWDGLLPALRRTRRAQCRRAFLASPYCLAPGVAVLLLHEEEVRGLQALHEAGAGHEPSPQVEWVLAAGALGA